MTVISFLLLSQLLSLAAEKGCAALLKAFSQCCLTLLPVLGGAEPLSGAVPPQLYCQNGVELKLLP